MKIDVILISYNQEAFIAQAVESLLAQSVDAQIRVLVADDCSTDSTLKIIRSYEAKSPFPFVYIMGDRNVGYHENYRRAFSFCEGDFVAILEGDDWWHSPYHLKHHAEVLRMNPRCSMSFNRIRAYDNETTRYDLFHWFWPSNIETLSTKEIIMYGNLLGNLTACMFRNELIRKLPASFYQLDFADWELGIWMSQYGQIIMLAEDTSTYRVSPVGQWSGISAESKIKSQILTLESLAKLMPIRYRLWFFMEKTQLKTGQQGTPPMTWKTQLKLLLKTLKYE